MTLAGDLARFEVRTPNRVYQDRLVHMAYSAAEGLFVRHVAAADNIDRIYANFSQHIERMILQSARLQPVRWDLALGEFIRRARATGLKWFVYGSVVLSLRGLDVDPADVDIWVDDPHLAGAVLEDLLVEPVTRLDGWVARWGGRAFHGALVEWLAGVDASIDEPDPHEEGPIAASRLETVRWRGHDVRVSPLDLALAVAERRGLHERAAKIRGLMNRAL